MALRSRITQPHPPAIAVRRYSLSQACHCDQLLRL